MPSKSHDQLHAVIRILENLEGAVINVADEDIADLISCLRRAEKDALDVHEAMQRAVKLSGWFFNGDTPDQQLVHAWFADLSSFRGTQVNRATVDALTRMIVATKNLRGELHHAVDHPENLPDDAEPITHEEVDEAFEPAIEATTKIEEVFEASGAPEAATASDGDDDGLDGAGEDEDGAEEEVEGASEPSEEKPPRGKPKRRKPRGKGGATFTYDRESETTWETDGRVTHRKKDSFKFNINLPRVAWLKFLQIYRKVTAGIYSFLRNQFGRLPDGQTKQPIIDGPVATAIYDFDKSARNLSYHIPSMGTPWQERNDQPIDRNADSSIPRYKEELEDALADALEAQDLSRASQVAIALDRVLLHHSPSQRDLNLEGRNITTIAPLEYLENLTGLDLNLCPIENLDGIQYLRNLSQLSVANTAVRDIFPILNLLNLSEVILHGSSVQDISPLAYSPELMYLSLARTPVVEIDPIKTIRNIEHLFLNRTQIVDIEPIRGLKYLKGLDISETNVEDIGSLQDVSSLEVLKIMGTQVSSLEALEGSFSIRFLDVSGTLVANVSPVASLDNLTHINISGTHIVDLEPLIYLSNLERVILDERQTKNARHLNKGVKIDVVYSKR